MEDLRFYDQAIPRSQHIQFQIEGLQSDSRQSYALWQTP